jgi:exodeoxyribonuclease III
MNLGAKILKNPPLSQNLSLPPLPFKGASLLIGSWNLAGYNAALKKGFNYYLHQEKLDILLLQETKLSLPLKPSQEFPFAYTSVSTRKKGYSGVSILSKIEPIAVEVPKLGHQDLDNEGRYICAEFDNFFLLNTYSPFAGMRLERLEDKITHFMQVEEYLGVLQQSKPVIWGGDINVAQSDLDLGDANRYRSAAGCTEDERLALANIYLHLDMVDSFRHLYPFQRSYSYFSYSENSFKRNLGWRIDLFIVSSSLMKFKVVDSLIRSRVYGASDHTPVLLQLQF